jgi:hypothetical protein
MDIDKQRISAVRTLAALGYSYQGGEWLPPAGVAGAPPPFALHVRGRRHERDADAAGGRPGRLYGEFR